MKTAKYNESYLCYNYKYYTGKPNINGSAEARAVKSSIVHQSMITR